MALEAFRRFVEDTGKWKLEDLRQLADALHGTFEGVDEFGASFQFRSAEDASNFAKDVEREFRVPVSVRSNLRTVIVRVE